MEVQGVRAWGVKSGYLQGWTLQVVSGAIYPPIGCVENTRRVSNSRLYSLQPLDYIAQVVFAVELGEFLGFGVAWVLVDREAQGRKLRGQINPAITDNTGLPSFETTWDHEDAFEMRI